MMVNYRSIADALRAFFAEESILKQSYPLVRVSALATFALSWHLVSFWALAGFLVAFFCMCVLAPFNPFRWKVLCFVGALAVLSFLFRGGGEFTAATVEATAILVMKVFLLISTALLCVTVLDTRSILSMTRSVALLRIISPALITFIRIAPHVKWIVKTAVESARSRGYDFSLKVPQLTIRTITKLVSPVLTGVLHFLDDYSDVLSLRGGFMVARPCFDDYRKVPSVAIFCVVILLGFIALKDWNVL